MFFSAADARAFRPGAVRFSTAGGKPKSAVEKAREKLRAMGPEKVDQMMRNMTETVATNLEEVATSTTRREKWTPGQLTEVICDSDEEKILGKLPPKGKTKSAQKASSSSGARVIGSTRRLRAKTQLPLVKAVPPVKQEPRSYNLWPVRKDAPMVNPRKRGSARDLDNAAEDDEAIMELRKARLANSTRQAEKYRVRWWKTRCSRRFLPSTPVTVWRVELAGALLKKGGYRSARSYLSTIKRLHIEAGHQWTDQHALAMSDARKACERGMGPADQADPLPLDDILAHDVEALGELAAGKDMWPAAGLDAAIISCAWLLREIESSLAMLSHVEIFDAKAGCTGCGWARWRLPASKTDPQALGVTRALGCSCVFGLGVSRSCPVAAMRRVVAAGRKMCVNQGEPEGDGPLIPRRDGKPMSKDNVVAFYQDLATMVKFVGRITGHSARVAGAMRMAYALHSEWTIQLFGRWGSSTVLRYVREALLGKEGGHIAQITEGRLPDHATISLIRQYVREVLGEGCPVSEPMVESDKKVFMHAAVLGVDEDLLEKATTGAEEPKGKEVMDVVFEKIAKLSGLLKDRQADTAKFVSCSKLGLRGSRHMVWSGNVTMCGRSWEPEQMKPIGPPLHGTKYGWCKACLVAAHQAKKRAGPKVCGDV